MGKQLPSPVVTWSPGGGQGNWLIEVHFAEVNGRADCVGLTIRSYRTPDEKHPRAASFPTIDEATRVVTTALLKQVPTGRVINEALRQAKTDSRMLRLAEEITKALGGKDLRSSKGRKDARRASKSFETAEQRKLGRPADVDYTKVAEVYLTAWRDRKPPTKAVMNAFGLTYTSAAKRVLRAREKGLIPAGQGAATRRKAKK